jgi:hypothetical protein
MIRALCPVTLDDLLDNLHRVKGTGYTGVSRLISHICYELCFERFGVDGCHVYHGDGADALYGDTPRVRRMAEELLERRDRKSPEEARTEARRICYPEEMESKRYFVSLAARFGAIAIMPYTDARLAYMSEVSPSVLHPSSKSFVKDALRRRYGLDDIVERRRVSMQAGLGLRDDFKRALRQRFASRSKSISRIVRGLSA